MQCMSSRACSIFTHDDGFAQRIVHDQFQKYPKQSTHVYTLRFAHIILLGSTRPCTLTLAPGQPSRCTHCLISEDLNRVAVDLLEVWATRYCRPCSGRVLLIEPAIP